MFLLQNLIAKNTLSGMGQISPILRINQAVFSFEQKKKENVLFWR